MNTPLLVLVGVSGAGKTSVGRLLAEELGVDFFEADDMVENMLGAPIAELVIRNAPRLLEARRNAALRVLTSPGAVVTLSASQIEDEQTLRALHDAKARGARVVELGVEISELARRQGMNAPRSVGLGAPRAQLAMMMKTLRSQYRDVADSSVQTGGCEPREIAESIVRECRLTGDSQSPRQ